jgi:hypothetical protein
LSLSENLILSGFTIQDEVTAKIVAAIGGDANFRGAAGMRARCFRVVRSVPWFLAMIRAHRVEAEDLHLIKIYRLSGVRIANLYRRPLPNVYSTSISIGSACIT